MKRPPILYLLLLLHLLLGTGALYGGWMLMTDADGFGVQPEWLEHSPFRSYAVPGIILFVINGLFPLFIAWGLFRKPDWPWAGLFNIYPERHWAWTYSLFSGLGLIIWINVQITMVPFFWLQPVFLTVGLLILIFTLWPGLMRYYQN